MKWSERLTGCDKVPIPLRTPEERVDAACPRSDVDAADLSLVGLLVRGRIHQALEPEDVVVAVGDLASVSNPPPVRFVEG